MPSRPRATDGNPLLARSPRLPQRGDDSRSPRGARRHGPRARRRARGRVRRRRQPRPVARRARRRAAAHGPHREAPRDVAQLRRVRRDSRRPRRSVGPVFRGDGGGPAGTAGARRRVLPARSSATRATSSTACARRATIRGSTRLTSKALLGGISTARAAGDAARRRRCLRLQRHRPRRAGRRSPSRIRASSASSSGSACGARKFPITAARGSTARADGRWRKKVAYMLDSSLAFSDLPIRLLFGVGMLALAVAIVYGTIVLVARSPASSPSRATRRPCC